MDSPDATLTAHLADELVAAWEHLDAGAFAALFTPDGTFDAHLGTVAVGTDSIRDAARHSFRQSCGLSVQRRASAVHDHDATLSLDISMEPSEGTILGPFAATARLRREGRLLSSVEISDYQGAAG